MNSESDNDYDPPITTSHTQREKHTIKTPNFFNIDKISDDYITNHSKKVIDFL